MQKSLIKVVQVVNDLISKPDMPSKGQIIKQLVDGVLLMRGEALKPELHISYRYLCAPSNPITTELFGDNLPKAVKDTNRITSKLSRETKQSYKRSRSDALADGFQGKYRNNYFWPSKNYRRPPFNKKEGGKKAVQKSQN